MMQSLVGFLLAIGILVSVHEWGHFAMARRLGVRVLRFSIGFGPILYRWNDKQATEYCLSLIPLGGYVKLYGERAESIDTKAGEAGAFYHQTLWKRAAIVLAGPLINLGLAWLLLFCVFSWGIPTLKPIIGDVFPQGRLAQAGIQPNTQILAVDGKAVRSLDELVLTILDKASLSRESLTLAVQGLGKSDIQTIHLPLPPAFLQADKPDFFTFYQAMPIDPVKPVIDRVLPGEPAIQAGLAPGDVIVAVDGIPVQSRYAIMRAIQAKPDQWISLTVERQGRPQVVSVKTASVENESGQKQGKIGIQFATGQAQDWEGVLYQPDLSWPEAFLKSGKTTWQYATLSLQLFYKMLRGEASLKHIGGPVTIAKQAGYSLDLGILGFLQFLALVSVSLGVLNLLPIPMLDGGHLLFYAYEAIRGQAMAWVYQEWAYRFGFMLLMGLMGLALYNDLQFILPGGQR